MATVFWNQKCALFVSFLERRAAPNAAVYGATLSFTRSDIYPGLLTKGMLLLHENSRTHTAALICELLQYFRWKNLDHPPYSPELVPCDLHLFPALLVATQRDKDVEKEVKRWLLCQGRQTLRDGHHKICHRLRETPQSSRRLRGKIRGHQYFDGQRNVTQVKLWEKRNLNLPEYEWLYITWECFSTRFVFWPKMSRKFCLVLMLAGSD